MCPVRAVTSGATWASSAPSMYTVRAGEQLLDVEPAVPVAAAAAVESVSQPSAGMIVEQIDERVRSFVPRNCSASELERRLRRPAQERWTSAAASVGVGDPADRTFRIDVAQRRGVQQRGEDAAGLAGPELHVPTRTPGRADPREQVCGARARRWRGSLAAGQRIERDRRRRARRTRWG